MLDLITKNQIHLATNFEDMVLGFGLIVISFKNPKDF